MIQLHEFPLINGKNISPFCLKVETYCKLANIPFQHVDSSPNKAPRKQLPFIDDQGKIIPDSSNILTYLKEAYGNPLDENCSALQHAQGRLLTQMCENTLYFTMAYSRWVDPSNWPTMKQALFADLPPVIKSIVPSLVQRGVIKQLTAQGTAKKPVDEIYRNAAYDLEAIAEILQQQTFAVADHPTSYDATVYAFLVHIVYSQIQSPLEETAQSLPALKYYVDSIEQLLKTKQG